MEKQGGIYGFGQGVLFCSAALYSQTTGKASLGQSSGGWSWGLGLLPAAPEGWRVSGVNSLCAGAQDGPSGCGGEGGEGDREGELLLQAGKRERRELGQCVFVAHSFTKCPFDTSVSSDPMGVPGRRAMVSALVGLMF